LLGPTHGRVVSGEIFSKNISPLWPNLLSSAALELHFRRQPLLAANQARRHDSAGRPHRHATQRAYDRYPRAIH
jgi:hypothetical protein